MELAKKAAQLPLLPEKYLYKDAYGRGDLCGQGQDLRSRVRNYFSDDRAGGR